MWIVLLWVGIIGSRPVSRWFGGGVEMISPDDYLEGSPVDRTVLFLVILAAAGFVLNRKLKWGRVFAANRWIVIFLLYCLVSITWSQYPLVAFKRWIKDLGNVLMVLLVVSERNPALAVRAVFVRYAYFVVPLSVILIKYFPDYARYYNPWTWQPGYSGVTTNKNELGAALFVCGVILLWDFLEVRASPDGRMIGTDVAVRVGLALMIVWLLGKADSLTAMVCLLFACGMVLLTRLRSDVIKPVARHLGAYTVALGLFVYALSLAPGALQGLADVAGRDMTLTGRTTLWDDLLREAVDPIFGTGFQSFWLGPGGKRMWEKYYFHPIQAHNGYLETYLNGGLVGLGLLLAMIVSIGAKLKKQRGTYEALRLVFFVVTLIYSWTEAAFNGSSLVWIMFLIAGLDYPRSFRFVRVPAIAQQVR